MTLRNGVRYLDGGWQRMVDDLQRICVDRGVEIRNGQKVAAVCAECEALLDRVRPDWRRAADHVTFRPRLVAATDRPASRRGGVAGRPLVAVPGTPDLFLAGDWVGPEGALVDASVSSGRAAGAAAGR